MTSIELERLERVGLLQREPADDLEIRGLIDSARQRLRDAERRDLSPASRFDLAYNAAHALALAALRKHGYRAKRRYVAFQALPHTLGIPAGVWRVLAEAHERRNAIEYEGAPEADDRLLQDLLAGAVLLDERLGARRAESPPE